MLHGIYKRLDPKEMFFKEGMMIGLKENNFKRIPLRNEGTKFSDVRIPLECFLRVQIGESE